MSTKHTSSVDADDQTSTVAARCTACDDEHPLGDRVRGDITTECPRCGDTRYSSVCYGDRIIKPDDERIADAVRDVRGVGDQTLTNIVNRFSTYYDFEAADERDLRDIDGVGRQTATCIVDNRP